MTGLGESRDRGLSEILEPAFSIVKTTRPIAVEIGVNSSCRSSLERIFSAPIAQGATSVIIAVDYNSNTENVKLTLLCIASEKLIKGTEAL